MISENCRRDAKNKLPRTSKGSGEERRTEGLGLVTQDRLKDTHKRLRELVLEVVLRVDRNVVLEHVERVLGLLVCTGVLGPLDDDV